MLLNVEAWLPAVHARGQAELECLSTWVSVLRVLLCWLLLWLLVVLEASRGYDLGSCYVLFSNSHFRIKFCPQNF